MDIIKADTVDKAVLAEFFEDKWDALEEKEALHRHGYFIEVEKEYQAFFALTPVSNSGCWLRSLYMKEGVPASLPLTIIESSIALARENGATDLYVYSHQPALNSLLSLLKFKQEQSPSFANKQIEQGTWWRQDVTSVVRAQS
ncbi:hypothetical protein [Aquibacillus albus]|uniref:GNAT family N-acetyltransferase n=1 Tax=Aquibacillus albus TaxID=1168171 RepID=A0ABS2MZG1_9BACI|nr:hypothetical protein [Aquibacillus albus]MBM7571271.1 hypothetical protein [Aquibacillus albus]